MAYSPLKKMVTSPLSEPVDLLLADVAIRVQLTNTDYSKAVERYHTADPDRGLPDQEPGRQGRHHHQDQRPQRQGRGPAHRQR